MRNLFPSLSHLPLLGALVLGGMSLPPAAAAPDAGSRYVPPFDAAAAGLTPLFDGKTLNGWVGDPECWKVVDGIIVGVKDNQCLMTMGDYDNFRIIVSTIQVQDPLNHQGVGFWGDRPAEGKYGYGGCTLVMPPMHWMWDYTRNSGPAGRIIMSRNLDHELGFKRSQWNQAEILVNRARGTIRMAVNGVEMLYYMDDNPARLKKGPIGLQAHGGNKDVRYQGVYIEVAPKENRLITVKSPIPSVAPVTANASPEARMLLNYINGQFGHKILTAQHGSPREYEYVKQVTGKSPAIWGTDLIFSERNHLLMTDVIDWWEQGAIPTIMWHWGAPTKGEGYEQSKMTIDVNRCFETGTPENLAMWADLKRIADTLSILRDAHVPVLWRPVHECSGGWFWYDKSGGEAFKKVWITMFNYFTKDRGLNNLIWVLGYDGSPDAAYNPGSQYYDIIGSDNYDKSTGSHLKMFTDCQAIVGGTKPISFHECGLPPEPEACLKDGAMWSWFMIWDSFVKKVDPDYLKKIYASDLVITLDQLPEWPELLKLSADAPPAKN